MTQNHTANDANVPTHPAIEMTVSSKWVPHRPKPNKMAPTAMPIDSFHIVIKLALIWGFA